MMIKMGNIPSNNSSSSVTDALEKVAKEIEKEKQAADLAVQALEKAAEEAQEKKQAAEKAAAEEAKEKKQAAERALEKAAEEAQEKKQAAEKAAAEEAQEKKQAAEEEAEAVEKKAEKDTENAQNYLSQEGITITSRGLSITTADGSFSLTSTKLSINTVLGDLTVTASGIQYTPSDLVNLILSYIIDNHDGIDQISTFFILIVISLVAYGQSDEIGTAMIIGAYVWFFSQMDNAQELIKLIHDKDITDNKMFTEALSIAVDVLNYAITIFLVVITAPAGEEELMDQIQNVATKQAMALILQQALNFTLNHTSYKLTKSEKATLSIFGGNLLAIIFR